MSPKFIELTRKADDTTIFVNPRRVNWFKKERSPTAQPDLDCGTYVSFGRNECVIVKETPEQIKALLK